MIFFIPFHFSPAAYFFSSICFNASSHPFSKLPSSAYFNSMIIPIFSDVQIEMSLYPSPNSALDWISQFPWLCKRSEEHTSELQSRFDLVCRLLLEKKKTT